MTTATIARTSQTREPTYDADPMRDIVAWMLGSPAFLCWTAGAGEETPAATSAVTRTPRPASVAAFESSVEARGDHDMTPEFVAWVLGTGYAAGRVPASRHSASSRY